MLKLAYKTGQAAAEYYVDPFLAADSGTGTVGDPYGDLQYALNQTTLGTYGTTFWIKAGTAEILAAALTFATHGSAQQARPITFIGYTSARDDGGIGMINAASFTMFTTNYSYVSCYNMKLTGDPAARLIHVANGCAFINCEIYRNAGAQSNVHYENLYSVQGTALVNCHFYDAASQARLVRLDNMYSYVLGCVFEPTRSQTTTPAGALILNGGNNGATVQGCIFKLAASGNSGYGIWFQGSAMILNNSIYSNAGTGSGIIVSPGTANLGPSVVANNLVEGFSGTGGKGITGASVARVLLAGNTVENCTADYDDTTERLTDNGQMLHEGNVRASASVYVNAGANNFDPSAAGDATIAEGAWPQPGPGMGGL